MRGSVLNNEGAIPSSARAAGTFSLWEKDGAGFGLGRKKARWSASGVEEATPPPADRPNPTDPGDAADLALRREA